MYLSPILQACAAVTNSPCTDCAAPDSLAAEEEKAVVDPSVAAMLSSFVSDFGPDDE